MNSIKGFNPRRFFLLIRNSLFLGRSLILIFSAAIGGMVILLSILSAKYRGLLEMYSIFYYVTLYTGGFILTENIFKELHHEARGAAWLSLPASTFEKFTCRLVITAVMYPIGIMMLFFLISLISEGIMRNLWGPGHGLGLFNPFTRMILINTLIYFILQSVFLLGGVYFKTHAIIMTILSLAIYSFIFYMIIGFTGKILFKDFFFLWHSVYMSNHMSSMPGLSFEYNVHIGSILNWAINIGFWYLLAPLCWVIGYFRLKEKEI
jgi:hypothetical protein